MRTLKLLFVIVLLMLGGQASGQSGQNGFVPFNDFLKSVQTVSSGEVLARAPSRVKDAEAFEEMRQHILTMYQGITVTHSFVLDSQYFDCVPIEQQPSVRLLGLKNIAAPPDDGLIEKLSISSPKLSLTAQFDKFGNSVQCEKSTIPMRRITIDEMQRFETMQQFLKKGSSGEDLVPMPSNVTPQASPPHLYAYTFKSVKNLGGISSLNIWRPYVNTGRGEAMSLSQQWYAGGSGAATQTAEVGWQVQPNKWGTENAVLFIYWTANNYSGTGCYNLDCPGFIQTNQNVMLGSSYQNYSTNDGTQYETFMGFQFSNGNWWLLANNEWVGYYPGSIYKGGQMAKYAELIEYGGETVGSPSYPPMGSGLFASAWWTHAAYQRNINYFDLSNNLFEASGLTAMETTPRYYTLSGPFHDTSVGYLSWGIYFFFGGPAGAMECLFDWAEAHYPSLFSPPGASTKFASPYTYRYYSNTNSYLGVSSANDHVNYLSPHNGLLDVGDLSGWLTKAGC